MEKISSSRNNNFNFLRLLLATLVLLSHSSELVDGNRSREILTQLFHTLSFGELAVDGFFILSGFLIVQSWDRVPQFLDFLKKRVLRIYPGFIIAALVSALVVGPLGSNAGQYFSHFHWPQFVIGLFRLQIFGNPVSFAGQPYPFVNAPTWTIAFEFRCYLLVAFLGILGAVKQRKVWLIFSGAILLISLFPTLSSKISFRGQDFLFGDLNSLTRLLSIFCAGGCFYLFRDRINYQKSWAIIAAALLCVCMFHVSSAQLGLATLGAYILFYIAFAHIRVLDPFKSYSDVSYGLYLYGWPLQKLILWYVPTISPWLLFPICWCLAYLFGFLSWCLVEQPFLRLKPKPRPLRTDGHSALV